MTRTLYIFAITCLLLGISNPAFSNQFHSDRKSGCKLAVNFPADVPEPREFEWTGECVNGLAEGNGTIIYYTDSVPYQVDEVIPRSGMYVSKGKIIYDISDIDFTIKYFKCSSISRIRLGARVPDSMNLKNMIIVKQIVERLSRGIDRRPDLKDRLKCAGRQEKEVLIVKESNRRKVVAILGNWPDLENTKREHFRIDNVIWTWKTFNMLDLEKALKYKNDAIRQAKAKQRNRRIEEDRKRRALAQEAARKRQAERLRRQRIEQERIRAEALKKEQARIAIAQAKTKELEKIAANDARIRDKDKPADSFCLFSCDPTERNGRLVLANKLKKIIKTPVIITKFRKTNGVSGEMRGMKFYKLYYEAHIELPMGLKTRPKRNNAIARATAGPKAMALAFELTTVIDFKDVSKKNGKNYWEPHSLIGKGKVSFLKTEQGWEGDDGVIYP